MMTKLYKLTDSQNRTRPEYDNECVWGEGVTHRGTGEGELCSKGYIHAYTHPLLAVLLNPIHGSYINPRLWEAEGEVVKTDRGLKVGCVELTTVRELPLPEITTEQRVRFATLCASEVYSEPGFVAWAEKWLSGEERSNATTAEAAARWAAAAAWAADWAAPIDLIAIAEKACAT